MHLRLGEFAGQIPKEDEYLLQDHPYRIGQGSRLMRTSRRCRDVFASTESKSEAPPTTITVTRRPVLKIITYCICRVALVYDVDDGDR